MSHWVFNSMSAGKGHNVKVTGAVVEVAREADCEKVLQFLAASKSMWWVTEQRTEMIEVTAAPKLVELGWLRRLKAGIRRVSRATRLGWST